MSVGDTVRKRMEERDQGLDDSLPESRFTISVDVLTAAKMEQLAKYAGMKKTPFCAMLLAQAVEDAERAVEDYENQQGRLGEFQEYMREGIDTEDGVKVGRVASRSSETLADWGDE